MSELGLLDQAMFKLEQAGMSPMYMCGAFILDTADAPYPVSAEALADHVAACMEEVPLMRQRLVQDPLKLGNLRLVDDPDFEVRKHITCSALESPGGYDQLMAALGEFSARRLDLTAPLWHFEIVEGLEDGRIALAAHIHHTIMDGMEGLRVLQNMFSEEPLPPRKPRKHNRHPASAPTRFNLVGGALLENMKRLYLQLPAFTWNNAGAILHGLSDQVSKSVSRIRGAGQGDGGKSLKVRKTSLNVAPLSGRRTVSCLELPLDEVRALARTFDCSINDLVLLFSSFALEHYFAAIAEEIDFDLVAGMPVNIRAEDDTSAGNALYLARVNLHNTITGIRSRLQAIRDETTVVKRGATPTKKSGEKTSRVDYQALGALFSPLLLDAMLYGIVRLNLLDKAAFVNVGISNLPGNQIPAYFASARVHSLIPMAPPADSLALTICATSTDACLVLSFHGCAETIRDSELFAAGARGAFQSLKRASRQRSGARPIKKRAKRPVKSAAAKGR